MFEKDTVYACLQNLIGFDKPADPCLQIDSTLLASDSGFTFADFHELAKTENLNQTSPNFAELNGKIQLWDIATNYLTGVKVQNNDILYKALSDNVGLEPSANPTEWLNLGVLSDFDSWLATFREKHLKAGIQRFFEKQKVEELTKSLWVSEPLFKGLGRYTDLITNLNDFVGFEIKLSEQRNLKLVIPEIGTQFNGVTTNFDLEIFLFHSSQYDAIATQTITITKNISFEWHTLTDSFKMLFESSEYNAGGVFYLGYKQSDLPGTVQAINRSFDPSKPCFECANKYGYFFQKQYSPFYSVQAFQVDEELADNLFDINDIEYPYKKTYGLNFKSSLYCDLSDFLCSQKDLLVRYLGLYVANAFIETIINSTRINPEKNQLFQLALTAQQNPTGISKLLQDSFEALQFDFGSLNSVCLPCKNKNKNIKFGAY